MQPLTSELKNKIDMYIKNGLDISLLIENLDIKRMNLSRAIIKTIKRTNSDISGCNFSNCIIGDPNSEQINTVSLINCKMDDCKFDGAKFVSSAWVRNCHAHNCRFNGADISLCDYQYTDFGENSSFCNAKITISTNSGIGAKFPKSMFETLTKNWVTKIKVE